MSNVKILIPVEVLESIQNLVDYNYQEEKKHFDSSDKDSRENHIFKDIKKIRKALNKQDFKKELKEAKNLIKENIEEDAKKDFWSQADESDQVNFVFDCLTEWKSKELAEELIEYYIKDGSISSWREHYNYNEELRQD